MGVAAAIAILGLSAKARETLSTPDWNITLTDFGYSDFMLDNTPGFEGREYLSGEWGAAVGYQVAGRSLVSPKWLEPYFVYPDWTTNSDFTGVTPIQQIAVNAAGLPIAESVIRNADLEITLHYEILDTVLGTPMGQTAASDASPGQALRSNRYVLKQTCSIKNITASAITNLQLFQLLHGLNSQRGHYDDRPHTGTISDARFDVSLAGLDQWSIGSPSAPHGLEDYIGFHSSVAPSAFEIGHYGIAGNGLDNHVTGKPSDGVHLSIEANWLTAPFSTRKGTAAFTPASRWVSGAERWDLADLAPGDSASLDVILSLRTGTKVAAGLNSAGGGRGGASRTGGLDFVFGQVTTAGTCFTQYSKANPAEVATRVAEGQISAPDFATLGGVIQIWDVEFTGAFNNTVGLTFAYDPGLIPQGHDPSLLCIYQFDGTNWQALPATVNAAANTIQVSTTSLSVFALGTISQSTCEVTVAADPGDRGTVSGASTYADGASVTLLATAEPGYVFSNWTENGAVVSSSPSYTFVINADHHFQAHFISVGTDLALTTRSLPVNGGSTGGDGVYSLGSQASVTATANPGYKFDRWLLNGAQVSTSPDYTIGVTGNLELIATFKPVFTVTTLTEPAEGGEVTPEGVYEPGQLAVVRARANPGFTFVQWTQNGTPVSYDPTFRYTVTGDRTLVANFVASAVITVQSSDESAGICAGGGTYEPGRIIALSATARSGYVFLRWTADGETIGTTPTLSYQVSTTQTILAVFTVIPALQLASPDIGGNSFVLSWPESASGWILQESITLAPDSWADSSRTIEVSDGFHRISLVPESGKRFFRLRHP
ncbi:MAG: hypothetical protein CFE26_01955 [Verrucomicrobiales bacterium VVV1]|nr:MAG: hypothetical protein CFE26_01955 [Verrucomicrobiales bacterium VVV1]